MIIFEIKIFKMKLVVVLFLGVFTFLYSCSSNEESVENGVSQEPVEQVAANQIANFDVSGMTCKMGCGGAIRKGLLQTGAVALVEIDFEEERPSNVITVHFDSEKSTENELLTVLNELNDNQFTANLISVKEK